MSSNGHTTKNYGHVDASFLRVSFLPAERFTRQRIRTTLTPLSRERCFFLLKRSHVGEISPVFFAVHLEKTDDKEGSLPCTMRFSLVHGEGFPA
jgi:hypothetical protein